MNNPASTLREKESKYPRDDFRYPNHTTIDVSRVCLISRGKDIDINDNFV